MDPVQKSGSVDLTGSDSPSASTAKSNAGRREKKEWEHLSKVTLPKNKQLSLNYGSKTKRHLSHLQLRLQTKPSMTRTHHFQPLCGVTQLHALSCACASHVLECFLNTMMLTSKMLKAV
ncbi:TPA: hypothetical protein ACH3X1_011034 [Trebouxia sp. C0004]